MSDNVNHPAHYTDGKIETIDFIRDKLTPQQFVGYCLGNVLKYVSRYDKKGNPVEDLEKAQVYLGWAVEEQKGIPEGPCLWGDGPDIVTPNGEVQMWETLGRVKAEMLEQEEKAPAILTLEPVEEPKANKEPAEECTKVYEKQAEKDPELEQNSPKPEQMDEKPKQKAKKTAGRPKKTEEQKPAFDIGKLRALRQGGWPVKDIADEMECSEATIYNRMKKAGIK